MMENLNCSCLAWFIVIIFESFLLCSFFIFTKEFYFNLWVFSIFKEKLILVVVEVKVRSASLDMFLNDLWSRINLGLLRGSIYLYLRFGYDAVCMYFLWLSIFYNQFINNKDRKFSKIYYYFLPFLIALIIFIKNQS